MYSAPKPNVIDIDIFADFNCFFQDTPLSNLFTNGEDSCWWLDRGIEQHIFNTIAKKPPYTYVQF